MERPSQHVLVRSSVQIFPERKFRGMPGGYLEARFTMGLPARGRSIEVSDVIVQGLVTS